MPAWFLAEVHAGQNLHHSLRRLKPKLVIRKVKHTVCRHTPALLPRPPPPPPFQKKCIPGLPIKRPHFNEAVPPGAGKNNISQRWIQTVREGWKKEERKKKSGSVMKACGGGAKELWFDHKLVRMTPPGLMRGEICGKTIQLKLR